MTYTPALINGIMWMQTALAFTFVGLRIYTRKVIVKNLGWDDVLIICSIFLFLVFSIMTSISVHYGMGKKFADVVPTSNYFEATKYEVIGRSACIIIVATSKCSVACFLLRLVRKKWHVWLLWFCIVTTTIISLFCGIIIFLQCTPAERIWNPTVDGTCWLNFTKVGLTTSSWSAVMDLTLALLPWDIVWRLNMKRKEKLTVAIGLSLGVFAMVCGIIRTILLQSLNAKEYIHDTVPMVIWSARETLVTILCASIVTLRPLYTKLVYRSKGSSSRSGYVMPGYAKKKDQFNTPSPDDSDTIIYLETTIGDNASKITKNGKYDNGRNTSEESILREVNAENKNGASEGIRRVDEVTISYDLKKSHAL